MEALAQRYPQDQEAAIFYALALNVTLDPADKIAPSAPHALHMPSHIFTRVGDWHDSIDTNRLSAEAAKDGCSAKAF